MVAKTVRAFLLWRPAISNDALLATAAAIAAVFIAAVYVPAVGRGFVKDDFGWIRDARQAIAQPSAAVRQPNGEFYRPLVTATFVVDYALNGFSPRAYGFTNLVLYVACALAIAVLLQRAGVSSGAAAVGAMAWAMNPHGINMAVVWLSGRTSLLLTLFSALAAVAFLEARLAAGALLLFAALCSKEEATVLPAILFAWIWLLRPERRRAGRRELAALALPLVAYVVVRSQTAALTISTAPWFYRPTFHPAAVVRNALEYLDRGATFLAIVAAAAALAYGWRAAARTPRPLLAAAAVWFAGGYALTVWLPVRSSLYAVFPSVGSALACAAFCDTVRKAAGSRFSSDLRMAGALACLLLLIPIYQRRNDRWVAPARISASAARAIAADPPAPGVVVLEDEPRQYASFTDAFGVLAAVAVSELTRRPTDARIITPPERWNGPVGARYKLTGGRVERVE